MGERTLLRERSRGNVREGNVREGNVREGTYRGRNVHVSGVNVRKGERSREKVREGQRGERTFTRECSPGATFRATVEVWYSGHIPECKVYVRNERELVHNTTPFVSILFVQFQYGPATRSQRYGDVRLVRN